LPERHGFYSERVCATQAVCFDLDGTLFDHRGSARAGVAQFFRAVGVEVTEPALASWFAAEDAQFERWRSGEVSFQEQRRQRLHAVLPQLGVELPTEDAGLDALFEEYVRSYRASWQAFPDSLMLLQELRARGYRLGLLTNGAEAQQLDKLARVGLDREFDVICVSERIGFQKPDVHAFLTLAAELGVSPSECLFVGDNADHDIAGARSAGMRGVLVDHYANDAVGINALVLSAAPSRVR